MLVLRRRQKIAATSIQHPRDSAQLTSATCQQAKCPILCLRFLDQVVPSRVLNGYYGSLAVSRKWLLSTRNDYRPAPSFLPTGSFTLRLSARSAKAAEKQSRFSV